MLDIAKKPIASGTRENIERKHMQDGATLPKL
jgi:hypothetical protein